MNSTPRSAAGGASTARVRCGGGSFRSRPSSQELHLRDPPLRRRAARAVQVASPLGGRDYEKQIGADKPNLPSRNGVQGSRARHNSDLFTMAEESPSTCRHTADTWPRRPLCVARSLRRSLHSSQGYRSCRWSPRTSVDMDRTEPRITSIGRLPGGCNRKTAQGDQTD